MNHRLSRRRFLQLATYSSAGVLLAGCGGDGPRYTETDIARLAEQWQTEAAQSGQGPYGKLRFRGYRGLAELPWFELDEAGVLYNAATDLPLAIDMHCHFGMSLLAAPELDLHKTSDRVVHLLDCDATSPGCELDLDIYINGNFDKQSLDELWWSSAAQLLWGSANAATQTLPNLVREMNASGVERAYILPIAFGLPFGDDLTERWMAAVSKSDLKDRFMVGASVHPNDSDRITKLRRYAAAGARIIKLHPTMQRTYPDANVMMELYAECEALGLMVFFHCGRAGIEPESTHRYALPRHYEAAIKAFPNVQFIMGHSGARDIDEAIPIFESYENVWFDTHGQGVTTLHKMLNRTGGVRMLYGTDWPFYHLAASLAKLLIITEGRPKDRYALLRGNAERLLKE